MGFHYGKNPGPDVVWWLKESTLRSFVWELDRVFDYDIALNWDSSRHISCLEQTRCEGYDNHRVTISSNGFSCSDFTRFYAKSSGLYIQYINHSFIFPEKLDTLINMFLELAFRNNLKSVFIDEFCCPYVLRESGYFDDWRLVDNGKYISNYYLYDSKDFGLLCKSNSGKKVKLYKPNAGSTVGCWSYHIPYTERGVYRCS